VQKAYFCSLSAQKSYHHYGSRASHYTEEGLAIFSQKIKVRKEQLQAKLAQKQSISLR
jgi:hypothetical protein